MSKETKPEPKPAEKFKAAMKQILSVPRAEIERREAEYQRTRHVARAQREPRKAE